MMYIENIYLCIAAPMLVLLFFIPARQRTAVVFVLLGMLACLLSAYVSAFFANVYQVQVVFTVVEIAPVVEEVIKFLPFVFYVLVFEPRDVDARAAVIMLAISFATFENICYLAENGASSFSLLVLRGFGAGAMHLACGALVSYGMLLFQKHMHQTLLKVVAMFSVLCVAIVYHGIFNLLVTVGGVVRLVGLSIPILTCLILFVSNSLLREL